MHIAKSIAVQAAPYLWCEQAKRSISLLTAFLTSLLFLSGAVDVKLPARVQTTISRLHGNECVDDLTTNCHDESNYPEILEGCVVVPLVPIKKMMLKIYPFMETTCINCSLNVVVDYIENAFLSWESMLVACTKVG